MAVAIIHPSPLHGEVTPPPSKSAAHRAIICAALSDGISVIRPVIPSDDMRATVGAMRKFGAKIEYLNNTLTVDGKLSLQTHAGVIDCMESGSTLRFAVPAAAAAGGNFTFTGKGRLPRRPIGPYLDCLPKAGVNCEAYGGGLPLRISGKLVPGLFELPGNVSSQFITGLLLALPLLDGDSRIRLTTPLESAGYVELTLAVMRRFGVICEKTADGYLVKGSQRYRARNCAIESDWSQAAFWLCAGAVGSPVGCKGLSISTAQGDAAILRILREMGADIHIGGDTVTAGPGDLHGIPIDARQIPDLVPILAATACFARGKTVIRNAGRLRIKESDRLNTTFLGLRALGARISETKDGLVIDGGPPLAGGKADGAGDHRIVMALAIAASRCRGDVEIRGCECIGKSYPGFFSDYQKLGGNVHVVDVG